MPTQKSKSAKSEVNAHIAEMLKDIPAASREAEYNIKQEVGKLWDMMIGKNSEALEDTSKKHSEDKEFHIMHRKYARGKGNPQLWKMLKEDPAAMVLHKLFNEIPEENKISLRKEYELLKLISGIQKIPFLRPKTNLDLEAKSDWVIFHEVLQNDTLNTLRNRAIDYALSTGSAEALKNTMITDETLKNRSRDKAWNMGRHKVFDAVLHAVECAVDEAVSSLVSDAASKAAPATPSYVHTTVWHQIERANRITAITAYAKRDIARLAYGLLTEDIDPEEAAHLRQARRFFKVWQEGCEPVCEVDDKIYVVVPPKAKMPLDIRKEEMPEQAERNQAA